MFARRELDQIVLDVEFVLLSVIQGVALTTLGIEGVPVLRAHDPVSLVFLASGLLFLLAFWAGALIHAVSFVRWPIDLPHYFFYFAVGLLEIVTFAQMQHPRAWFAASVAFYVLGAALYAYDLSMIAARRAGFERDADARRLYAHIRDRQRLEMFAVMPAGFLFSLVAWWLLGRHSWALPLAALQLVFTAAFLASQVKSFSERVRLIDACVERAKGVPAA